MPQGAFRQIETGSAISVTMAPAEDMNTVPPAPPVAPRQPSVRELHGERLTDDYAWMRERDGPALHDYLAAERHYYDAHSHHLNELTDELAAEAAGRVPAEDEYSVSWPVDGFMYRTRVPAGSDNPQLLRTPDGESTEQLLLDENLVAAPTGFAEIGAREPSPDGNLLVWSADTSGAEYYDLRIRDLRTGEDLSEIITGTVPGQAWSAGSDYLFYLVCDAMHRPSQVWRHRVGTAADTDALVYEEPDERFELALEGSRSGALAIITAASRDTTEVSVILTNRPLEEPLLIEPRRRAIEYRIDHARGDGAHAGTVYVVTDLGADEFTLMRAPVADPSHWTPVECAAIAPARADTRLLRCDVLVEHLVMTVRRKGNLMLVLTDHEGGHVREIPPSVTAGAIRVMHADDYDRGSVIIAEESLIEPTAFHRLDLEDGTRELLKRTEVPGYDADRYVTERLTAPAQDGTPIPVTVARRADTPLDGSAPCVLYGYGAYEASLDPDFDRSLPSLLDRGVVYAVAHVRGGGECGRRWWQQGRLQYKPNTFTDHLAVADWLAGENGPALVDGRRIVSRGLSAGGLLQGAVYSMRPDRWCAVVAEVPFVDCVNTMLDPSIPLTAGEWDEWGDPRKPDEYAWLRSYSPYDNPPHGARPPLLVTGAVNDPRVGIHEPAKWVARLRATDTDGSLLLFRAVLGVGAHGGPSGRSARWHYEAEIQAFMLDAMGLAGG
jgi:oligopeptidase B